MTDPAHRGLVCAHRGASLTLKDNSIEAFTAAIAAGCDVLETDVRMGRHGRLVLAHDLADLDDPDVVELAALLELAAGRVGLDLEIMESGLGRPLLDAVDGFDQWLIVTSEFPQVLVELRRLSKGIDTGLVAVAPFDGDPLAAAAGCGASVTLVEDELATPELLRRAGEAQLPFWVWTVNDAERLARLFAQSAVTGVITDDPALAVAVRASSSPTDHVFRSRGRG
ncbi:glycerophosphodiester phosphodiesterase [uncultured Jatrophihabitans sp.]|uniref:glycerophosphodiester phosphodiesterase n=1 Tax=uncultured Jatrophihabitans sp. TaxID=1610747 RepID=UPI0035CA8A6D